MDFEEIVGNQILAVLGKLGICENIRSVDLFVAIQIIKYSVVLAVLMGGFALVRRLKTPERRAIGFACVGAAFVNLLLLSISITSNGKVSLIGQIVCFALINLMFVGIAFLPKLLKKLKAEDQLETKDFHYTEANATKGAMKCPGCGKRTISKFGVLHVAQTCGECGRKYKLVVPIFVKILEPTILLGSLALAYFMISRGIQKSGVAILIVIISVLLIPILKTKLSRLTQV